MINDPTIVDVNAYASGKSYASVFQRLAAYAVDAVLLFVIVGLLLGGIFALIVYLTIDFEWTQNGFLLWAYVFSTVSIPCWLYYAFLESGARQATVGMRLLGLRVMGLNGERVSFKRALLRTIVKLVPFEVNHAVMFLPVPLMYEANPGFRPGSILVSALLIVYLVSVVLTARKQSVHDLVANTVVVREK